MSRADSNQGTMTQNCIVCLTKAQVFTGHVLRGARRVKVTAGWCKEHLHKSEDMNLMQGAACFGAWKPEYGIRDEFQRVG